ncbi:hypothetical protein EUREKA_143 [Mycobacterium phage Eureka]|uniref:Uncharacterized protein n=1 Tax=Mycobacterium phage Eureka TaxID=2922993 RepID=G1JX11_9CAUD|nr:hypothetical protein FDG60_gp111 [Mycobacterium phage Eureka]AEL98155.1 hypothetical protein EUREKA_143 [Mycobacterium phage Eureka]
MAYAWRKVVHMSNPFCVGQSVKYAGGRVRFIVRAIDGHMVTMTRADGRDGGNATTTSCTNLRKA